MKKTYKLSLSVLFTLCLLITISYAINYPIWYAYDDNTPPQKTTSGYYHEEPLVGKVITCQNQVDAAKALVYGYSKWNDADFLPFELSWLSFNSNNAYNVAFISGSRTWLESENIFEAYSTKAGETFVGSLDSPSYVTFSDQIQRGIRPYYGSSNEPGTVVTKIAVVAGYTDDFYRILGAHELGHALGWVGHSTDSTQLMKQGTSATTVGNKDRDHIKTFYDLFY